MALLRTINLDWETPENVLPYIMQGLLWFIKCSLKVSDKIRQVQLLTCNKLMFMYVKAELVSQFSKFHVSLWIEVLSPFQS